MQDLTEEHEPAAVHVHVVPLSVLFGVWALLIILTAVTVAVVHVDLGRWNIVLALGIATVKGAVVALYFMHLRYDRLFNSLLFVGSLAVVMLFVGITLMDTQRYQRDIQQRQPSMRPAR